MTEETKIRIRELRDSGYSYSQVADQLHENSNTVKAFCWREKENS